MMTDPGKPNSPNTDRAQLKRYLVPVGALAVLVVIVVLVVVTSFLSSPSMSDGSDGTINDPGLREISPGVLARDIKVGLGDDCPPNATVTIHVTGWLESGEEFQDTKGDKKGSKPQRVSLPGLMKGFDEGIPGMKPGGIRKLVISADKGFGANGMPPKIPPGATLIYEIEMLGFEPSGSAEGSAEGTTPPRPRRKAPTDHTKLSDGSDPAGTDSGLLQLGSTGVMYRDITVGDGQVCPRWATVVVDYSGWLTTGGRPFDSSWKNNIPYTVPLSGVIKGWQEGVPGMRVGGVRKLVIPPALGYGSKGNRGIPGEATLVFEIELLGIK